MHPETYEQEIVDKELFADMHDYFVEDMEASLSFHEGEVVAGGSWLASDHNMVSMAVLLMAD